MSGLVSPTLKSDPAFLESRIESRNKKSLQTVRKHLHGLGLISLVDLGHLFELAHTTGGLGAEQVALSGVHAENLAGAGYLKALGGSAMSFQLQFRFRSVAWHCFVNPLVLFRFFF